MVVLLWLYVAFVTLYLLFNGWIIRRIWELRLPGDFTSRAVTIYMASITGLVVITLILASFLNWSGPVFSY